MNLNDIAFVFSLIYVTFGCMQGFYDLGKVVFNWDNLFQASRGFVGLGVGGGRAGRVARR